MDEVVIISACRTPIGSFCGALSSLKAHEIGGQIIKEALVRANLRGEDVSEVIMGQALTGGQGQNPARQASIKAGIPIEVPAHCVNMLCGSGLKSVHSAFNSIKCGDSKIVVCGGQESMSQAPHTLNLRTGTKMGPATMQDSMLIDGLTDAMSGVHMGITAEEIASTYKISREEQDQFALDSQLKTKEAVAAKRFQAEISPIRIKERSGEKIVSEDEYPKPDTSIEQLRKLRTVFKSDGSVTAGNASGINDGAAAVVLASAAEASRRGITPIAKIIGLAHTGLEPMVMGLGPITAVQALMNKVGWSLEEVDLFEFNEAFAVQSIAVQKQLGVPPEKINVNGGAIAIGHPIGASGTRILVTLLYALQQRGLHKGVAALCVGGGMGIAIAIQRL